MHTTIEAAKAAAIDAGVKLWEFTDDADACRRVRAMTFDTILVGIDRGDGTYTPVEFAAGATREKITAALLEKK